MSSSPYSGSDSVGRGKKLHLDSQELSYVKEDLAEKSGQVGPQSVYMEIMGQTQRMSLTQPPQGMKQEP